MALRMPVKSSALLAFNILGGFQQVTGPVSAAQLIWFLDRDFQRSFTDPIFIDDNSNSAGYYVQFPDPSTVCIISSGFSGNIVSANDLRRIVYPRFDLYSKHPLD